MRKIKNVFISTGGNNLQLIDIYFDTEIKKIIPIVSKHINWKEIATEKDLNRFINHLPPDKIASEENDINGSFMLLIAGTIDAHVHFNTPGYEEREDFEHGSSAAAYGGVTTVIDMPCTSVPPVTSVDNMNKKLKITENRSCVDFAFWGGVSGNDFGDNRDIPKNINELSKAGVVGFKSYMISGMNEFTDLNEEQLLQTAKWIKQFNGIMAVHAEDRSTVNLKYDELIRNGRKDWKAYCEARSIQAEVKAIIKLIEISRKTGCRIHVVHLSSAKGLELIRNAKDKGIKVTAETCPHYLFFTQEDFNDPKKSAYLKTAPPVKLEDDKDALWEGLKDGTIAFVTTDHAGCDPQKEKLLNNFWEVYGGIPGVEHRVPFLFSEGLIKRNLNLSQIIDLLSSNTAAFFNLKGKGNLRLGNDADMALINLWEDSIIKAEEMHSKGKYTPFEGEKFKCKVEQTILRGKVIMNSSIEPDGNIGYGKFVSSVS